MVEIVEQALGDTLKALHRLLGALLERFHRHTWEEPNRKRGAAWTILAWVVGLSALVLAMKGLLFVGLAALALHVMQKLEKPKIKVKQPYKSRRKR